MQMPDRQSALIAPAEVGIPSSHTVRECPNPNEVYPRWQIRNE